MKAIARDGIGRRAGPEVFGIVGVGLGGQQVEPVDRLVRGCGGHDDRRGVSPSGIDRQREIRGRSRVVHQLDRFEVEFPGQERQQVHVQLEQLVLSFGGLVVLEGVEGHKLGARLGYVPSNINHNLRIA